MSTPEELNATRIALLCYEAATERGPEAAVAHNAKLIEKAIREAVEAERERIYAENCEDCRNGVRVFDRRLGDNDPAGRYWMHDPGQAPYRHCQVAWLRANAFAAAIRKGTGDGGVA